MEKSLRELLLKDLCARLPYGVVVQITSKHSVILGDGNESDESDEPYNVSLTIGNCDSLIDFFNGDWVIGIKPYLRPMSSMTEEEKKEFTKVLVKSQDCSYENNESSTTIVNDWYLSKGFDVRGLIPKGLALEAPEDMYK